MPGSCGRGGQEVGRLFGGSYPFDPNKVSAAPTIHMLRSTSSPQESPRLDAHSKSNIRAEPPDSTPSPPSRDTYHPAWRESALMYNDSVRGYASEDAIPNVAAAPKQGGVASARASAEPDKHPLATVPTRLSASVASLLRPLINKLRPILTTRLSLYLISQRL